MFEVFRRRRRSLLAAVTIMAMFAFAFPLTSYFGGGGPDPRTRSEVRVVETIFGRKITNQDLEQARWERQVANTFVYESLSETDFSFSRVPPEYIEDPRGPGFGPTRDPEAIKDAIRMAHKADQFGIKVTDDMIRSWIKAITAGKLTTQQFQNVVKRVSRMGEGLNAESLFSILRGQLRIKLASDLVIGRIASGALQVTPYEAWQYYRRINDKLGLEVIPVPVADFVEQIADPGSDALRELYAQYVKRLPDPASPEPGFKEPRRVNLQYASVSFDGFALALKSELEVTDEEIQKYYEANKELYRVRSQERSAPEPAPVPEKPTSETPQPTSVDPKQEPEKPSPPDAQDGDRTTNAANNEPSASNGESPAEREIEEPKSPRTSQQIESDSQKQPDAPESKEQKDDSPQYKTIEEVTPEIQEILAREKARAELARRFEQLSRMVNEYARVYLKAKDKYEEEKESNPDLEFVPPDAPDFVQASEESGFNFAETGIVALEEEAISRNEGLGDAIELRGGRMTRRGVVEVMSKVDFYEPSEFKNLKEDHFLVWKIADLPEREPGFEEIRDKVLAAYRTIEAREPARAKASKLAESLRQSNGDMAKFRDENPGLSSISIPPTPLWTSMPIYSPNLLGQSRGVRPTELPGLRFPSDEFRAGAFALKEGEVAVAPNQPLDTFYVALLTKREPANREEFARLRLFIEDQVRTEQTTKMVSRWLDDLREESADRKGKAVAGN